MLDDDNEGIGMNTYNPDCEDPYNTNALHVTVFESLNKILKDLPVNDKTHALVKRILSRNPLPAHLTTDKPSRLFMKLIGAEEEIANEKEEDYKINDSRNYHPSESKYEEKEAKNQQSNASKFSKPKPNNFKDKKGGFKDKKEGFNDKKGGFAEKSFGAKPQQGGLGKRRNLSAMMKTSNAKGSSDKSGAFKKKKFN